VAQGKETKHTKQFCQSRLRPGEEPLLFIDGWIGEMMGSGKKTQHNGALIITTERVVFYRKGFFGEVVETIPHKKITSIETRSLFGYRVITVHTSNDELSFKTFDPAEIFEQARREIEDRLA
jgi:hypothetical protein